MSAARAVSVGSAMVSVAAYFASLGLGWLVAEAASHGFFAMIDRSSALTSFLGVAYLLLTSVALGLGSASAFSPPRYRWYATGALLAAVLGLGAVIGLGYRITAADFGLGAGWYVALIAALAMCVATSCSVAEVRR